MQKSAMLAKKCRKCPLQLQFFIKSIVLQSVHFWCEMLLSIVTTKPDETEAKYIESSEEKRLTVLNQCSDPPRRVIKRRSIQVVSTNIVAVNHN